jgi:tRNA-splicing ligase RtcB (3'-phosphate/5'-hydroxy nucleic acid ligase)
VNVARLPFVFHHVAVMPDVHAGKGATIGSVIATKGAIVPSAVGVDIGCGVMSLRINLTASALPDNLEKVRSAIEAAVPHGRTNNGGANDCGAWKDPPAAQVAAWEGLKTGYESLVAKYPRLDRGPHIQHLGTLGSGNHFIELSLDESDFLWIVLHSGSRGVGNRIGCDFIDLAKSQMRKWFIDLPDADLAYLPQGTEIFDDYLFAAEWAQEYARINRELMMAGVLQALYTSGLTRTLESGIESINCHHNYVAREHHFGENVFVTRKGAVRARKGDMGIIPGSMATPSYITRGLGNEQSFHSCAHGAGRAMSRTEARKRFTVAEHEAACANVECRKDLGVIDETPMAYKSIDAVMNAQRDLVEIVHTLRQVVCIKG